VSATQDARLPPYEVQRRPLRSDARVSGAGRASAYTAEEILEAIRSSDRCYGEPPISIDWESARARRMGHPWRAERFEAGEWPTARMVRGRFGNFNDAVRKAGLSPRRARRESVRQVAASRSAGDPVALHAALMDVAAAALACAEVATADGRAAPGVDQNRSN
jgi:hypothetical protein